MPFFRRADYTSGITDFLTQLKADKPTLDKKVDRSAQQDFGDAKVAQKPYVYQTSGHPNSQ
jgi:hypothetical protein